jgi:uncharacterized protein (TIGR00299 family) protein
VSAELRGQHLHFEPTSGIAGDMAVAALVDAGVPQKVVTEAIAAMGVPGLRTRFERRQRGAYVGRGFVVTFPGKPGKARRARGRHEHQHQHEHQEHQNDHVHDGHAHDHVGHDHNHEHAHDHDQAHADHDHDRTHAHAQVDHDHDHAQVDHDHDHRDYAEIRRLLRKAKLAPDVRALSSEIFARLAEVESALHGVPIDDIGFHEVGSFDSIADVVGVSAAIAWLAPASIGSGPPVVGSGRIRIAHGVVPVPAPATAELLRGVPILVEGQGELTTPTGAAILATVVDRFGAPPPMRVLAIGYGAGTRQLGDRPNVLRVMVGAPVGQAEATPPDTVTVIEANIDDMSPELVAPLFEALLAAGALDVWSTPILMKKGRPAMQIAALAPPGALAAVQRAFFRGSTTLGLRMHVTARLVLARSLAEVTTPYGKVRVKVGSLDGQVTGAQPEFEDCRRRAAATGTPVREVMSAAAAAARALLAPPAPARSRRRLAPAAPARPRKLLAPPVPARPPKSRAAPARPRARARRRGRAP